MRLTVLVGIAAAALLGSADAFQAPASFVSPLGLRGSSIQKQPLLGLRTPAASSRASRTLQLEMAGPKIIIAGAPASGKGTQCEFLVDKFGVVHISTGDALREQVTKGTELGKLAKEYMDKGALVPDDVIIGIVESRLAADDCKEKGWLLDGFPRTGVQADAMDKAGITADKFILLNVPDDILIERCVGRRSDPETGKIYHLKFNPPPEDPEVQARLVHRSDDTEEAMVKRIEQYKKNVDAIKDYYKDITKEFDGAGDKMELAASLAEFVAAPKRSSLGPVDWEAASAGANATVLEGGNVAISGSGTVVAASGFGVGEGELKAGYWEYEVQETGRGSWVGVVEEWREGEQRRLPDLNKSLSGVGWGLWGGETGGIHPMYCKGKVLDQTIGFKSGQRVGLRVDAAKGTVDYFIDGEEVCCVFEGLPSSPACRILPAVSNGWEGTTRVTARFQVAPEP